MTAEAYELAVEVRALFDSFLQQGFNREEALKLVMSCISGEVFD